MKAVDILRITGHKCQEKAHTNRHRLVWGDLIFHLCEACLDSIINKEVR